MINWPEILTDLQAQGYTLTQIAAETGTSVQQLSNVKQGKTREILGTLAVKLYDLHRRKVRGGRRGRVA